MWISLKIKSLSGYKIRSWRIISSKIIWLYYFLLVGIILGLLNLSYGYDGNSFASPLSQIFNYSLYILTVILFIKILIQFRFDFEFHYQLMLVFSLSVLMHLIANVLPAIGYSNSLPSFLVGNSEITQDLPTSTGIFRFVGLLGDYELIVDYCLIVIGFSVILYFRKHRIVSIICIIASLLVAIMSGTRSSIIGLVIFTLTYFLTYTLKNFKLMKIFRIISVCTIILFCFIFAYSQWLHNFKIFNRLEQAYLLYQETGSLQVAANRDLSDSIPIIIKNTSFLGNGSLFLNTIGGDSMVSHNLLFAIYAKYGLPGLLLILYLFYSSFRILIRNIKFAKLEFLQKEFIVILSIVMALFFQQMKVSALRFLPSLLIYTFLFMHIYFLSPRAEIKKNE